VAEVRVSRLLKVSTPQFRSALIRKLKNIAPDFHPEFLETSRGVSFHMLDGAGHSRSKPVTIYRNRPDVLHKETLLSALRAAGFPGKPDA
jgi:hypothetical protein